MAAFRKMLRCKVHRATVTHADLNYEGSLTLAPELLEAAGLLPYEALHVWNVTSGARFETYAICGRAGSSDLCVNGAAAHLAKPGDIVIVAAFTYLEEAQALCHEPRNVFVDRNNRVVRIGAELPGPQLANGPAGR